MDHPGPKKSVEAGLPDDALVEILSRLPVKALHRSKCVAKAWRDLVDDPLHRSKLPQTLRGFLLLRDEIYGRWFQISGSNSGKGRGVGFLDLLPRSVPLEIDPCLTFLTKLPEIHRLLIKESCNGLLLFEHYPPCELFLESQYIVCNPIMEQWVTVPNPPRIDDCVAYVYLVFDPAVSPHFHLHQFWSHPCDEEEEEDDSDGDDIRYVTMVRVYSSETGRWTGSYWDEQEEQGELEEWRLQGELPEPHKDGAVVQGMLHVLLTVDKIVVVDVQGKTRRTIAAPVMTHRSDNQLEGRIFQSLGHLHYIVLKSNDEQDDEMSVWVLEDYNTEDWVLKHTVSIMGLFELSHWGHDLVTIHPDCNVVFFCQPSKQKLVSYNMDSKEVRVISISDEIRTVPYVPCFRELLSLNAKS
ncbi:hypothetical protein ACP70R_045114 [Stipagrostis hirtigluma subsp. patula]